MVGLWWCLGIIFDYILHVECFFTFPFNRESETDQTKIQYMYTYICVDSVHHIKALKKALLYMNSRVSILYYVSE